MRLALLVILGATLSLTAAAEKTPGSGEQDSDEAIMAAAERMVSEGIVKSSGSVTVIPAPPSVTTVAPVSANDPAPSTEQATAITTPTTTNPNEIAHEIKKEAEIPLFTKSENLVKSESNLIWRLVASLVFVALTSAGLIYAGKRWTRQKNQGGEKTRIEMLHQFHMGPKKSLALIRVAGEVLLIGCTDQSINMLKSVALIDDELTGAMDKDFNNFLDDEFTVQEMRSALRPRS